MAKNMICNNLKLVITFLNKTFVPIYVNFTNTFLTVPKYISNMLYSVQKESANDLRNMQIVKPCGCYAPKVYLYTA